MTAQNELREVVALAIFEIVGSDITHTELHNAADAAIEAMLKAMETPSEGMGMAAFRATQDMTDLTSLAEEYLSVWQAMLTQFIKEQSND